MTITGLGYLGGSSLLSPPSAANGLDSSQGTASNPLSLADFSSASSVLQALPPGTVQSGYISSAATSTSSLTYHSPSSSVSQASAQNSIRSGSFDISYSTSLQTLQSLGLIQSGDVLTSSSVRTIFQQAQQSTSQSESVSQQTGSGTQSSAAVTTQQSASEQNEALLVTQNWTTPNGVGFVFQEMVRVNDNTLTQQAGAGISNTSSDSNADSAASLESAIAAIAGAALPTNSIGSISTALANQASSANGSGSSVSSTSSALSGFDILGTMDSGASTYLTPSATAGSGDTAMLKQTDSLLALLESIDSLVTANFSVGQQIGQ